MGFLREIKQTLNQKSVMRNILFCLAVIIAVIIFMKLLYGSYRSSTVLQEGMGNEKMCAIFQRKLEMRRNNLQTAIRKKQPTGYIKRNIDSLLRSKVYADFHPGKPNCEKYEFCKSQKEKIKKLVDSGKGKGENGEVDKLCNASEEYGCVNVYNDANCYRGEGMYRGGGEDEVCKSKKQEIKELVDSGGEKDQIEELCNWGHNNACTYQFDDDMYGVCY